jgi:hypothetical protein
MPRGQVDVTDFGAAGNAFALSPTLDDAAFQNALASGADVYYPSQINGAKKNYLLSQPLVVSNGQTLFASSYMCDPYSYNTTYMGAWYGNLVTTNKTGYTINIGTGTSPAAYARAVNVSVVQHPSYVPTAGGLFSIGWLGVQTNPPRDHYGFNMQLLGCNALGGWRNYHIRGFVAFHHIDRCHSGNAKYAGFHMDVISPSGGSYIRDCTDISFAANGNGGAGLLVDGTDTTNITGFYSLSSNVWLRGNTAPISHLMITDMNIETANFNQFALRIGDGPNVVEEVKFVNLEVTNSYNVAGTNNGWHNNLATQGAPGKGILIGPNSYRTKITQAELLACYYVDQGVMSTFADSQIVNFRQGPWDGSIAATLSGTGGKFHHVDLSGYVKYIGVYGQRNEVSFCTGEPSIYGNTTYGIENGLAGSRIIGNDFSRCTTNITNPVTDTTGRYLGNIGLADH